MRDLYENKIDNLLDNKHMKNKIDLVNNMVEMFYNEIISEDDKKLLALAFKDDITQEDLDLFITNWDIEAYGDSRSLILAYIMKDNSHLKFSRYEKPRLSGLLNYHRFSNLKIIAYYTKLARELNKNNVKPLIIKGGAMKHLRQDLPRVMGDIDILTIGKDFDTACDVARELGYEFDVNDDIHSIDLHAKGEKNGAVDVHRYLDFETEYDKSFMKDFFKRGTEVRAFGAQTILPCPEDLMFIVLANLAKNLHNKTSTKGIMYALFDCKYLINSKPDFNWDIIVENAAKANAEVSIYFAIKFLNKLVPGILPEDAIKNDKIEKTVVEYSNRVIYSRFYVQDLKLRCKKLKIKNALKCFKVFKQYAKDKPKHFVLKRIKKSSVLISIFLKIFNK